MNIGEASKAAGVSAKMIRYYEEIGLIPRAARTESGYRAYSGADVHRLHFIRRARDLGFAVGEIRDLLGLWNDRSRKSADVKRLAKAHIAELEIRIREMQQMADTLQTLIDDCNGDERPECPILATLEQPGEIVCEHSARGGSASNGNAFGGAATRARKAPSR